MPQHLELFGSVSSASPARTTTLMQALHSCPCSRTAVKRQVLDFLLVWSLVQLVLKRFFPHFCVPGHCRATDEICLKWFAVLVKLEDGKEFELIGNAFKITASVVDVPASAAISFSDSRFAGMSGG